MSNDKDLIPNLIHFSTGVGGKGLEKRTNTIMAPPPQIGSSLIFLFAFVSFPQKEPAGKKMRTGKKNLIFRVSG